MKGSFVAVLSLVVFGSCGQVKDACTIGATACIEFTGSFYLLTTSEIEKACTTLSGTLGTSCATEKSHGTCKLQAGQPQETVKRFYTGDANAQKAECDASSGTWTAG